jgi:hypothetical protein
MNTVITSAPKTADTEATEMNFILNRHGPATFGMGPRVRLTAAEEFRPRARTGGVPPCTKIFCVPGFVVPTHYSRNLIISFFQISLE